MAASLTISKYSAEDQLWSVIPGGKKDKPSISIFTDTPTRQSLSPRNRFNQILHNSIADVDYDETLLPNKDRMNILAGGETGSQNK